MGFASIKTLEAYSPPGNLSDLTADNQELWSKQCIAHWIQSEIKAVDPDTNKPPLEGPNGIIRTPLSQFFDGTVTPFDLDQTPAAIPWIAFPNLVTKITQKVPQRWQIADQSREYQDEYLEWSVARDDDSNVIIATFTCEGPEYWQFLANSQSDTLWDLYRSLNPDFAAQMQESDLYLVNPIASPKVAVYNPNNRWNDSTKTGSIAHLIQRNNTLSAEIDIAGQATVIRKDPSGNVVTNEAQLIACSQYGNAGRNSDPAIGIGINNIARGGRNVSVANPVALYMNHVNFSGLQLDQSGNRDQSNLIPVPEGWYNWQRGDISKNMGLRLQIKAPAGAKADNGNLLTVSDIYDTNKSFYMQYGAQFADYITMSVSAVVADGTAADPQFCPKAGSGQPHAANSIAMMASHHGGGGRGLIKLQKLRGGR